MTGFYVSDALGGFTVSAGSSWKYPGCANTDGTIGPNQAFRIGILSCSLRIVLLSEELDGLNWDLCMTMYDVTEGNGALGATNVISPDQTNWPNIIRFGTPYGTANNGIVMNQSTNGKQNDRSYRNFAIEPLMLEGVTPDNGHDFIVGAAFKLHSGITRQCQYDYHVHGYWTLQ